MYQNMLIAGSNAILTCVVDDYNIGDFEIAMSFLWSRSERALSDNNDRVEITNLNPSQPPFMSQLSLSPLSSKDANISCSATSHLVTPVLFIEMSSTNSSNVYLTIEGRAY